MSHVLSTPLSEVSFRVFDIEATGLSPTDDDIIEIAVFEVRAGKITKRLDTLVKPRQPIPARITQLTGIALDPSAPALEEVFPAIVDALSGDCLVAHHARSDLGYLTQALWRCDPHWTLPPAACTLKLSRALLPGYSSYSLFALAEQLHLPLPTHRAAPDALATAELLLQLIERSTATTLEEFISLRRKKPRPQARISPLAVYAVPETAGVYRFFDTSDRLLYVGYSNDMQRRVREHLFRAHSGQSLDIAARAVRVESQVFASPLEAFIAEGKAIAEERPLLNVRNAEHGRLRYFKLSPTGACTLVAYAPEYGVGPLILKRSERDVLRAVRTAFGLSARGGKSLSSGVGAFERFARGGEADTQPLTEEEWHVLLDVRRACRQAEAARLDERAPFLHPTHVQHVSAPHIVYTLALGHPTSRTEEGAVLDTYPSNPPEVQPFETEPNPGFARSRHEPKNLITTSDASFLSPSNLDPASSPRGETNLIGARGTALQPSSECRPPPAAADLDALGKRVAAYVRAHPMQVRLTSVFAGVPTQSDLRVHHVG